MVVIDEYFEEFPEMAGEYKMQLPNLIRAYIKDGTDVSKYNEVPATLTFFNLLGQIVKDKVVIVRGKGREDSRVPILWLQTSGTGKTELFNFYGPIAEKVFEILNTKYGYEYDIFDITDFTDAALIGSMKQERQTSEDEDGNPITTFVDVQTKGALEGSGLMVFDEFEYSGVFKQSQHKENVVMYLNTFMNSLHGENWVITKKLKEGDTIECRCQRSLFATTYIPKTLTGVIAEKGVIQRCAIYIREVPQTIQDELRDAILEEVGTIRNRDLPITKFANNFVKMYEVLKQHYEENGEDPLSTVKFGDGVIDALKNESWKMRNYVTNSRPEVFEIASNFITRLNGTLIRMAVLSAIAEAPSITDKSKRFIVTERNVRQASFLVRQCYQSLVSWLDMALKVQANGLKDRANLAIFKKTYKQLRKGDDDWVNKTAKLDSVRKESRKGQATVYRWFNDLGDNFETKMIGRRAYVRFKEAEGNE